MSWNQYPYSNPYENQYSNPYQNNQYNKPNNYVNVHTPQFQTNKIYVKGPEEALFRTSTINCTVIYFDENEKAIYEVKSDLEGKKQLRTLYITNTPVTQFCDNGIEQRLQRLENAVFVESKGGAESVNE